MEKIHNLLVITGIIFLVFAMIQIITGSAIDLPFSSVIGYSVMPHFPLALCVMGCGILIASLSYATDKYMHTRRTFIVELIGWLFVVGGLIYLILEGLSKFNSI